MSGYAPAPLWIYILIPQGRPGTQLGLCHHTFNFFLPVGHVVQDRKDPIPGIKNHLLDLSIY